MTDVSEEPAVPKPRVSAKEREIRTQLILQHANDSNQMAHDMLRWTIASLLLANGGALIALLQSEYTRAALFDFAGWAYVAGFLFALVAGFLLAFGYSHYATKVMDEIWSGEGVETDSMSAVAKKLVESLGGAATGIISAFVSFLLFIGGCLIVADIPSERAADQSRQNMENSINAMDAASASLDALGAELNDIKNHR